jgi:hypothetical protein
MGGSDCSTSPELGKNLAFAALLIGAVLVLSVQLILDSPAESNPAWHWIQHGLIFAGGVAVGAAAAVLFAAGQRRV